jgi:hypothetical protein
MAGLTDIVSNVDYSGLTIGFMKWLIGPIIIFFLVWAIIHYLSYNIRIKIYSPGQKNSIGDNDRARETRDSKTKLVKRHQLKKFKKDWEGLIPAKFFIPFRGSFNRIYYEVNMIRDQEGNLQPIIPPRTSDVTNWEGMGSSDVQWALNVIEEGHSVYMKQSFWMQHGATIMAIGGFLIVGVIMLVLFKQLDVLAAAFNNAADKASEALIATNQQVIR